MLTSLYHKIDWRVRLLRSKIARRETNLTWSEVARGVLPTRLRPRMWLKLGVVAHHDESGTSVLWRTPVGNFWGCLGDQKDLAIVVAEQLMDVYQRGPVRIRSGDVVLDGGAHLGVFTRRALACGARLVVAFEPEPWNAACLRKTFASEIRAGTVVVVEAAAWKESGSLCFDGRGGTGRVVDLSRGPLAVVGATTIDATVQRLGLERMNFIKLDIEGAEQAALKGARETIARFAPRMAVCVYHREEDPVVIPNCVCSSVTHYRHFFDPSGKIAYFAPAVDTCFNRQA